MTHWIAEYGKNYISDGLCTSAQELDSWKRSILSHLATEGTVPGTLKSAAKGLPCRKKILNFWDSMGHAKDYDAVTHLNNTFPRRY